MEIFFRRSQRLPEVEEQVPDAFLPDYSQPVLQVLAKPFPRHGPPVHIRSGNGPEFVAKAVRSRLARLQDKTLVITPRSPWESEYDESLNE